MTYVEVCKGEGIPLEFPIFGRNTPFSNGLFPTIKQAIEAIGTLNYNGSFTLFLRCDNINLGNFDEFIIIPEGMRIEFRSSLNATIRAVELKQGSSVIIGDNIQILTLINGVKQTKMYGCQINYQKQSYTPSLELEKLHKSLHSKLLAARFTEEYTKTVYPHIISLVNLLKYTRNVTSNFQILLTLFYLEDYFKIIETKIRELTNIVSNEEDKSNFKMIECGPYFQKQLDSIAPGKREMLRVYSETEDFQKELVTASHPSTVGTAVGYRDFLCQFLGIVGENVWMHRQLLTVLMEMDEVASNSIMVHLNQVNHLLGEVELLVNHLVYYVHRTEDPLVLYHGDNSSELVLDMATLGLHGPKADVFKKGLITFLNESTHVEIDEDSVIKNDELLAHLRDYMRESADADYFFVRFMKNHPDVITSLGVAWAGLSTLGTLTSTLFTVLRSFKIS